MALPVRRIRGGLGLFAVFRLLAGGGIGTQILRQQGCRLELFLYELRVDLALFLGAEFAPRHGHFPIGQLLGRRKRDARAEHLMHFGTHDAHHVVGAIQRFGGDGLGEGVLAQGPVEFDPQFGTALGLLVEHDARHLLTIDVASYVVRQTCHQSVPLLIGRAVVVCRQRRGRLRRCLGFPISQRRVHGLFEGGHGGCHAGSHGIRRTFRCRGSLHGLLRHAWRRLRWLGLGLCRTAARSGHAVTRGTAGWLRCRIGGRGITGHSGRAVGLTSGEQARGKQLQTHARRNRTGHTAQRGVDGIGHRRQRGQAQRGSLTAQIVHVFGGGIVGEHAFRTFPAQREHKQITYASEQILHKTTRIESSDHDLLHHAVQRFAVLVDHGIDRLADQRLGRETEQCHGGIVGNHTIHGTDHELVEHGQRIAHGAAAGTHGQPQHTRLGLDMLVAADSLQIRPHDLLRHQTERIMVGARADGADHLVGFGGGEDEHDMFRWLLHDFEQCVEALRRDHVGLVEDEDLVAVAGRGETGAFAQFTGVIHAVVRGGVDFDHVDGTGTAGGQIATALAFAARMRGRPLLAVHASGQNTRGRRFAATARAGKKIGVRQLAFVKRAHERNGDLILPDHPVERIGAISSVQCQCHSKILPP